MKIVLKLLHYKAHFSFINDNIKSRSKHNQFEIEAKDLSLLSNDFI